MKTESIGSNPRITQDVSLSPEAKASVLILHIGVSAEASNLKL